LISSAAVDCTAEGDWEQASGLQVRAIATIIMAKASIMVTTVPTDKAPAVATGATKTYTVVRRTVC